MMRKTFLKANRSLIAAAAIAALGATNAQAANISWIGPNASFWDLATNWNPALPGAVDDVLLGAFDTTFRSGTVSIQSFIGTGTLSLTGGSLSVSNASSIGGLAMTSGTIGGTGSLTIAGASTWTGGTMSGTGSTVFNGPLTLSGDGSRSIPTAASPSPAPAPGPTPATAAARF